jgi:hypothetical protein
MSVLGGALEDTEIASLSNWGGATRAVLSATKRSKIKAIAKMEQASKGQIGQPAACMIDSNGLSAQIKQVPIMA